MLDVFGDNVKYYRELRGMTQNDLAQKVGVARWTISSWELGKHGVSIDKLVDIAKALNISPAMLVHDRGRQSFVEHLMVDKKARKKLHSLVKSSCPKAFGMYMDECTGKNNCDKCWKKVIDNV